MIYKDLSDYFGSVSIELDTDNGYQIYDISWATVSVMKGYDEYDNPIYEYITKNEVDEHLVIRLCFNWEIE